MALDEWLMLHDALDRDLHQSTLSGFYLTARSLLVKDESNYDGFDKHRTEVGEGAFVGSNSSLVAPVRIGAGAYTGSGSVISKDVADNALALERGPQVEKPGWAAKFRALKAKKGKT